MPQSDSPIDTFMNYVRNKADELSENIPGNKPHKPVVIFVLMIAIIAVVCKTSNCSRIMDFFQHIGGMDLRDKPDGLNAVGGSLNIGAEILNKIMTTIVTKSITQQIVRLFYAILSFIIYHLSF